MKLNAEAFNEYFINIGPNLASEANQELPEEEMNNSYISHPILIINVPIPRIENYTCLCVNIDERLTWEKHIDMICSKVSAGIGAIRSIRPFVSPAILKLIYNAIAQPYFDYCNPLWDNCGIGLKDRLQKFQNRLRE